LQEQLEKIVSLQQQVQPLLLYAMQPVNQLSSIAAKEIFESVLQLQSVYQDYVTLSLWVHRSQ
jgi:hypothetical protein